MAGVLSCVVYQQPTMLLGGLMMFSQKRNVLNVLAGFPNTTTARSLAPPFRWHDCETQQAMIPQGRTCSLSWLSAKSLQEIINCIITSSDTAEQDSLDYAKYYLTGDKPSVSFMPFVIFSSPACTLQKRKNKFTQSWDWTLILAELHVKRSLFICFLGNNMKI